MGIFNKTSKRSKNTQIRQLLKESLSFDGFYWYPLHAEPKADVTEYFEADCFLNDFGTDKLIKLLESQGYTQLWELTELEDDSLIEVKELDGYCGVEKVYCDTDAEWAIYFSHENTVTFAGEAIVSIVQRAWSKWDVYKDPWYS